MADLLPRVFSERFMKGLEESGHAEVLFRPAAEEEFGKTFRGTRSNQLVAKVSVTKYYRHTQFGYEEIPNGDIGGTQ